MNDAPEKTRFIKMDELIAREAAGESFTIHALPTNHDPLFYDIPVINPMLAREPSHVDRASINDCPMCEAGHEATPSDEFTISGRSEARIELERMKSLFDGYSKGDMEITKAFHEMRDNAHREYLKPLLDIVVPALDVDFASLERRALAMLEAEEIYIGRNRHLPLVVYVGDHFAGARRRSLHDMTFDGGLLDEGHHFRDRIPEPIADFYMEPKKKGKDFVGRHGEMPIPSGKRKKFKRSRNANKGRKR